MKWNNLSKEEKNKLVAKHVFKWKKTQAPQHSNMDEMVSTFLPSADESIQFYKREDGHLVIAPNFIEDWFSVKLILEKVKDSFYQGQWAVENDLVYGKSVMWSFRVYENPYTKKEAFGKAQTIEEAVCLAAVRLFGCKIKD